MSILGKIQSCRAEEEKLRWEGTFREYLDLVKKHPHIAMPAHARIYEMIRSAGVEGNQYSFFSDELFGMDEAIKRLVEEYFHPAAKKLDVRKRILLLMGPVGGGKSTIVSKIKRGMEQFTRTDAGAVYAIKKCQMAEDPLHLIPRELRDDFFAEYGIRIEGSLSPLNAYRLEHEFGGRIEDVPVERIFFSEDKRRGIGTFSPSDPKSQDIADLTGSIYFSTIAEYGQSQIRVLTGLMEN